MHIRDSRNPGPAHLTVAPGTWADFLTHASR
ncbi:DUF397 domain-containing protein [Streptomyces poriticola]